MTQSRQTVRTTQNVSSIKQDSDQSQTSVGSSQNGNGASLAKEGNIERLAPRSPMGTDVSA